MQPEESLRLIREGHFSHLGPAGGTINPVDDTHQATLDEMLNTMGYRFVMRSAVLPRQATPDEPTSIRFTVENTGSAPFYYPWPIHLVWVDESGEVIQRTDTELDIREWLPGKHTVELVLTPPQTESAETLFAGLHIPDPSGQGPAVRFANLNDYDDGTLPLGTVEVINETRTHEWRQHE